MTALHHRNECVYFWLILLLQIQMNAFGALVQKESCKKIPITTFLTFSKQSSRFVHSCFSPPSKFILIFITLFIFSLLIFLLPELLAWANNWMIKKVKILDSLEQELAVVGGAVSISCRCWVNEDVFGKQVGCGWCWLCCWYLLLLWIE